MDAFIIVFLADDDAMKNLYRSAIKLTTTLTSLRLPIL